MVDFSDKFSCTKVKMITLYTFVVLLFCAELDAYSIQFVNPPKSYSLPSQDLILPLSQLGTLNLNLLGLSTKVVPNFAIRTPLFERPVAVVLFELQGTDNLALSNSVQYSLNVDDQQVEQSSLPADIEVDSSGITGLFANRSRSPVLENMVETHYAPLRTELLLVHRLVSLLDEAHAENSFADRHAPIVITVTIRSLKDVEGEKDRTTAVNDVVNVVERLADAVQTTFNRRAIFEVICIPVRHTRSVPDDTNATGMPMSVMDYRRKYNVSIPVSSDYPAIFAIFAGVVIMLSLTVIYVVVGMLNVDHTKGSLVYKLAYQRLKKD